MDREQMEQTFQWKITAEIKLFKERVLQTEEEEMEHSLCSIIKNITEGFAKNHRKQEKQGKAG